jgi:DNA primase
MLSYIMHRLREETYITYMHIHTIWDKTGGGRGCHLTIPHPSTIHSQAVKCPSDHILTYKVTAL